MLGRILLYPFTRGAVVVVAAMLVGLAPYGGILTVLLTTTFALPVVRTTASGGPDGDRMPRLVPPPPGLGPQLALGAVVQLVYFGPFLLVLALAFLVDDVPQLESLSALAVVPLFAQLFFILAWPAAMALLASGDHPFTTVTRRVLRKAEEMRSGYAVVAAWLMIAGGAVMCGAGPLRDLGLVGRLLASVVVSWFWLVALHLTGRALRGRPPFPAVDAPERPSTD